MSIGTQIAETAARLSETELKALERLAARAIEDKSFARKLALDPSTTLEERGLTLEKLEGAVIKFPDLKTGPSLQSNLFCHYLYFGDDGLCLLIYFGEPL